MSFETILASAFAPMSGIRLRARITYHEPKLLPTAAGTSLWGVPISLSRPFPMRRSLVKRANVFLVSESDVVALRWASREYRHNRGVAETTLEFGRQYMVQVAIRKEDGDRSAAITDDGYLLQKRETYPLDPGVFYFRILVRAGKNEWISPGTYELQIPVKNESNGHFVMRIAEDWDRY